MSSRRALILVENLSVPFDRRVWQEARALRDAGWHVVVVCPRGEVYDVDEHEILDGIEIHRYRSSPEQAGRTFSYLREYGTAFRRMRQLARALHAEAPFDVVHACNPPDFLLHAARSLRRSGCAFVFDHHDLVPELYQSRFGGRGVLHAAVRALERSAFRLADVVISTNESYRTVALERGGKDPRDVFVVRSAPDSDVFAAVAPNEALRRGKRHLLAYLGVMAPQDGVDHALRALAHLRRTRDDWHAVFVGSGDASADLHRLTEESGLDDVVEFTGRLLDRDIVDIFSTADICLVPDPKSPLNEISSMNKVVEYMALGRPIVAFDLHETRVTAASAAVYARPNDDADFADCIAALLDDPGRRAEMGVAARERFVSRLSWESSRSQLVAAYDRALLVADARQALASGAVSSEA